MKCFGQWMADKLADFTTEASFAQSVLAMCKDRGAKAGTNATACDRMRSHQLSFTKGLRYPVNIEAHLDCMLSLHREPKSTYQGDESMSRLMEEMALLSARERASLRDEQKNSGLMDPHHTQTEIQWRHELYTTFSKATLDS